MHTSRNSAGMRSIRSNNPKISYISYQILMGARAYDIDHQLFTLSTCTTTRGHTKKLFKYRVNSHTRSKFFSNRVIS